MDTHESDFHECTAAQLRTFALTVRRRAAEAEDPEREARDLAFAVALEQEADKMDARDRPELRLRATGQP
jgi:hypothetical protein